MSVTRANTPIKLHLLPDLARDFPKRARTLGLTSSGLLSALVWNDHLRPNLSMGAQPPAARLAREKVTCSLRSPHRKLARVRAKAQRLSFNAYLESLIHADHARRHADLVILSSP